MTNYKESGVDWIGQIPENWKIVRLKDYWENKKEIAKEKASEYERLALTLNGVIKRSKEDSEGLQPKEFETYQILEANDFVFKMIDLQNISTSRVGLSSYTGLVSPAYIRFSPKNKEQEVKFTYYYLMSLYYNCVYNSLGGDGVRSALNATDMGNMKCPYPSPEKQKKIVEFLDKKCLEVDRLIELENQQIEKLKEYKQAVITEAVTKGLDKNAKMKDSGIEWIGDIPENWTIQRIKNLGWTRSGIANKKPEDFGFGFPFLTYKNVYKNYSIDLDAEDLVNSTVEDREKYSVKYGDAFFTGSSETVDELGFSSVALKDWENAVFNGFTIRLRPYSFDKYYPEFMKYLFRSDICRRYLSSNDNSITRANLGQDKLKSMYIVDAPIDEQKMIAEYLDKKCLDIDSLIVVKNKKIEELQQYKKSMIYEYVTGKKEIN